MNIELIFHILSIIAIIGLGTIIACLMTAKPEPKEEEEVLVTEHKILLGYKIANIWIEEDAVFFIYE
jgi:hypothetical protein